MTKYGETTRESSFGQGGNDGWMDLEKLIERVGGPFTEEQIAAWQPKGFTEQVGNGGGIPGDPAPEGGGIEWGGKCIVVPVYVKLHNFGVVEVIEKYICLGCPLGWGIPGCIDWDACKATCKEPEEEDREIPEDRDEDCGTCDDTPDPTYGEEIGGGGYGGGGGKARCEPFPCMKEGGTSHGGVGIPTYREEKPALAELQKKFMKALALVEVGAPVQGNTRGDPPGTSGKAHGCLQIRQPYWQDAMEYYARRQFQHAGTPLGLEQDKAVRAGPPSCPRRWDYAAANEQNGRPEGFAFLEAYSTCCEKYWTRHSVRYTNPQSYIGFWRSTDDGGTPTVSRDSWYKTLNTTSRGGQNYQWSRGNEAVIPALGHPNYGQPMGSDSWNQSNNCCTFLPKNWDFGCACDYSKWVASMTMRKYSATKARYWNSVSEFSPRTLGRMHHLGPGYAKLIRESGLNVYNHASYNRKLKREWIAQGGTSAQYENNLYP